MVGAPDAPPHNAEIIAPCAITWLAVGIDCHSHLRACARVRVCVCLVCGDWERPSETCAIAAVINCRIEMRKRVRLTLAEIFVLYGVGRQSEKCTKLSEQRRPHWRPVVPALRVISTLGIVAASEWCARTVSNKSQMDIVGLDYHASTFAYDLYRIENTIKTSSLALFAFKCNSTQAKHGM